MQEIIPTITREELRAKIERGEPFTLVETLPRPAYESGHLPGAINLPPNQVRQLAKSVLPDKFAYIVVYCASPT